MSITYLSSRFLERVFLGVNGWSSVSANYRAKHLTFIACDFCIALYRGL